MATLPNGTNSEERTGLDLHPNSTAEVHDGGTVPRFARKPDHSSCPPRIDLDEAICLKVVIDQQLTGWKDLREGELRRQYDEIRKVGEHPDLPRRLLDKELGKYCKRNDCAFITSDIKAFTHFLNTSTIDAVKIRKYGHNKESDQVVYLIEIVSP